MQQLPETFAVYLVIRLNEMVQVVVRLRVHKCVEFVQFELDPLHFGPGPVEHRFQRVVRNDRRVLGTQLPQRLQYRVDL